LSSIGIPGVVVFYRLFFNCKFGASGTFSHVQILSDRFPFPFKQSLYSKKENRFSQGCSKKDLFF